MKNKIIAIGSFVLIIVITLLAVAFGQNNKENVEVLEKNISIMVFNKESESIYNENIKTECKYLIDVLEEIDELDVIAQDDQYGAYITSIKGIEQGDNYYWSYYIDNEYATTGVSNCVIENEKCYSFKIEKF